MNKVYLIIGVLLGIVLVLAISTMIFWGLGSLITNVFNINYDWTILHGLTCALIFAVLKSIFGGK